MDLIAMTEEILAYGEICDHCLGRMVGKRSFGLSNDQRGHALRVSHALAKNEPFRPHEGTCWICQDLFSQVGDMGREGRSGIGGHRICDVSHRDPGTAAHGRERGDGLERSLPHFT